MIELLRLFGKEIEQKTTDYSFLQMNKNSLKKGYLVTGKACTQDTLIFLNMVNVNPNATFYKQWDDIINKDRLSLFVDQLIHYASTYGTNFTGKTYIPNDGNIVLPDMKNIKVIDTITKNKAVDLLENMLYSPMAMKEETIKDILSASKKLDIDINVDDIKNKELKMLVCSDLNVMPTNMDEFVRFLIYKATDTTLLIKSPEVIKKIKESYVNLNKFINESNIRRVASVFYRYKPIFLAFKKSNASSKNTSIVNKLRKLAPKCNKPKEMSFWSDCFNKSISVSKIFSEVKNLNIFKTISLIETCNVKLKNTEFKPYIIRNGKVFIKANDKKIDEEDHERISNIRIVLHQYLLSHLAKKACKVKLPENINLTLPHSEKSFIGNYPLYTSVDIDKNTIVGIYWKNEWGAHDLDLSLLDKNGNNKIGWDDEFTDADSYYTSDDFYNANVIFSGDMTNADPEAAELLLFHKNLDKEGIIHVNRYNGKENSEYNLFVAREDIKPNDFCKNYMCNPDNIILSAHDKMDSKEKSIALLSDKKLILASLRTGRKSVSEGTNVTSAYVSYIKNTFDCRLSLETELRLAGFSFVKNKEEADIDFSNPTKEKFMDLLF